MSETVRVSAPASVLLADFLAGVRDLVLPVACVCCGDVRGPWCARCTPVPGLVPVEVRPPPEAGPVPGFAAGRYEGSLRAGVIAYKEHGVRALARPLGVLLAEAASAVVGLTTGRFVATGIPATGAPAAGGPAAGAPARAGAAGPVLLLPVPSTAAVRRRRNGDHVDRLARAAVSELRRRGLAAAVVPALRVVRAPADSVGLGAAARWANLAGAYGVTPSAGRVRAGGQPSGGLGAARLVLVDDVVTTGATLAEAWRAAASGGLPPLAGAAVVAATPLRPVPAGN